jgi:SH3-like domain-containing protein
VLWKKIFGVESRLQALLQQEDGENNIKVEFSPNIRVVDFDWLQQALLEARRAVIAQPWSLRERVSTT